MQLGSTFTRAVKALTGLFTTPALTQGSGGLIGGLIGGGASGAPVARGTQAYLSSYSSMPWVRGVAGKIAQAVSATPWQLLVIREQGRNRATKDARIQYGSRAQRQALLKQRQKQAEVVEITEHPMLDLLNDANSFHTGLSLRKLSMIYLDLIGDCFWLKQRNALGAPIAAWPIPPHWITKVPTVDQPFYEMRSQGQQFLVDDTEMLWMSDSNPENPYSRGVGHMQSVSDELEIGEYGQKMVKQVFFNRARPDLLVMPKEGPPLSESDVDRLEQRWSQATQGFWRAFRPFFMKRAVEVKVFEQNFQSIQMTQLLDHQRDTIFQVFGIPPEIMGVLSNSNRATIEAAEYLFMEYVVVPRLEFIRQQLQSRLVPEYDDRLILDYVAPTRSDKALELEAAKAAPWALSMDEWRELQGFEEKEDGSGGVHMIPANLFPVNRVQELEVEEEPPLEEVEVAAQRPLGRLSNQELRTMRTLAKKLQR